MAIVPHRAAPNEARLLLEDALAISAVLVDLRGSAAVDQAKLHAKHAALFAVVAIGAETDEAVQEALDQSEEAMRRAEVAAAQAARTELGV